MEDLSLEIEQRINPCILEDFGKVSSRVLEDSLQGQRRTLRDCVDPQGSDFRGSAILKKLSRLF